MAHAFKLLFITLLMALISSAYAAEDAQYFERKAAAFLQLYRPLSTEQLTNIDGIRNIEHHKGGEESIDYSTPHLWRVQDAHRISSYVIRYHDMVYYISQCVRIPRQGQIYLDCYDDLRMISVDAPGYKVVNQIIVLQVFQIDSDLLDRAFRIMKQMNQAPGTFLTT